MSTIIRLSFSVITSLIMLILLWSMTQTAEAASMVIDDTNFSGLTESSARFAARPLEACSNTITVTAIVDNGPGTLRQALTDVCNGGTISFAAPLADQTITLTSTELSITKTVTLTNPDAPNLKISGNKVNRVFNIQTGAVVTMSSLSIISGSVIGENGGGILINSGALLTVNNSIISGNSAISGAGIMNYGILILNDSILSSNSAALGSGGIVNTNVLTVNNSTFIGNSTTGPGGGVGNSSSGIVTLNNSTFSGNSASSGGGVFNASGGRLTLNNSTLSGNSANPAGNIRNEGMLHFSNTILANSFKGEECNTAFGIIVTNNNNLVEDGTCNPALSGDPNLGPLANYGGSTPTYALLPGSPAINAGDNTACLAVDQRNVSRPQIGQCDIGAFESRGFTLTISGGNNQTTLPDTAFGTPLEVTVTNNVDGEPVDNGLITFTAPVSGPSTTFAPTTTAIISGGMVSLNVTANTTVGGPYNVVASAKGGNSVNFSLSNAKLSPTLTVTSSVNPSLFGQLVIFTATVSSDLGTPTGNATFIIDGTPQPPIALVDGQATFSTATLLVGNHTIGADYSGDANFSAISGLLTGGQTVINPAVATVQFSQATYTDNEDVGTSMAVTLSRAGDLGAASQVQVSISDGTAEGGVDYSNAGFPLSLTFGSGVVSQTVPILLIQDTLVEPTETLSLTVIGLSNAVIGTQNSAVLQILDEDTTSSAVYLPLVIK